MPNGSQPSAGSVWDSIRNDGRLKLAGGVALLAQVVSVALAFTRGDPALAVFGGAVVVAFMILLMIFIAISNGSNTYPALGNFLIWSVGLAFVASIGLMLSSFFGCWPAKFGAHCRQELRYVRGDITNVPAPVSKQLGIAYEGFAFSDYDDKLNLFRFVVLENRSPRETLTVKVRSKGVKDEVFEDIKVHISCVRPFMTAGREIEWRYEEVDQEQPDGAVVKTPTLFDHQRRIGAYNIRPIIRCDDQPDAAPRTTRWWEHFLPDMTARAQSLAEPAAAAPSPVVREAIRNLTAEDIVARRSAREVLASSSVAAVPSLLEAMRAQPDNYRAQLGGSVALTEMLRRDKSDAARIAPLLGEQDRALLLDAAGAKDRTLHIYASEFLYDLGDPQVSRQAVGLAAKADDENARYNWLLVAQGGWHKLSPAQKQEAGADLARARDASGPQTLKLFEKLQ